jgi:hypothetical protein
MEELGEMKQTPRMATAQLAGIEGVITGDSQSPERGTS